MKRAYILPVLCLALCCAHLTLLAGGQAKPANPGPEGLGFSADVTGVQDGAPVKGKIFFMPERFRMEQTLGSNLTILIMDRKKKMMWIINPGDKTYVEIELSRPGVTVSMPFPDETGKPCAPMKATSCRRTGRETVNGRQCDLWELSTTEDGKTVKTTLWLDPILGSPIRWRTDNGSHYDFTNIKPSAQPDSLFQVPAGFNKKS